jgi:23S rRNA (uracil1939-C5)-methyltransferase
LQITNDLIELTIDSLSYNGGRGVGRFEGVVVFVPQTAPGDVITARITNKKARFWEGELVSLLKPSPDRRVPPCPVADRCGGCSWQHVNYAQQTIQKQKILSDSLRPLRKLAAWAELPFLAAPDEFHYRNRVQVQVSGDKKGFFGKRSHDLVEVEKCWIADEAINRQLRELKPAPGQTRLELRASEGRDFAQVNDRQNAVLQKRVVDTITGSPDWLMDLYAGSGNLTGPLRENFPSQKFTAVELSGTAVERGRTQLSSVEWHAGDVGKVLKQLTPQKGGGVVVLDPPRTGCEPAVIEALVKLAPKQIVYVSCNPTTFARDAVKLVESGAYRVESVQGLDMFPQTEHVEMLASLRSAT